MTVLGYDGLVRPGLEADVAGCPSNECQIRKMCTSATGCRRGDPADGSGPAAVRVRSLGHLLDVYEAARAMWLKDARHLEEASQRPDESMDEYRERLRAALVDIARDADLIVRAVALAEATAAMSDELSTGRGR